MKISISAGIGVAATLAFAAGHVLAPLSEVRPVLEAMRDQLPSALINLDEAGWSSWSQQQDNEIRARLEQGELDSMVNLLLFGTSFTKQPRIQIESLTEASRSGVLRSRVDDLVQGLRSPGGNERLVILRNLIRRQGLDPDDRGKTGVFIYENLQRVLQETVKFGARAQVPSESVFRDRGVSLDTAIPPNFVIEESLRDLKGRGLIGAGAIARVAVVGPGLDFVDKQSGYDYYPQQTLQPFAVYDSLVRLDLAKVAGLNVTVFDISARVLEHLRLARERAQKGRGYLIQLPRDPAQAWSPSAVTYWHSLGDGIGKEVASIRPPSGLGPLEARAVEIRPAVVLACDPVDLNIVLDRMNLPAGERFDLIVATNVFVYYDRLAQALALQNVSTLLKPGGLLLTNDALPEIPQVPLRKLGETAVRYSDQFGESVFWYRREQ